MLIQTGRKEGMCALNDSLLDYIAKGLVEPVEAYQKSVVKDDLIKRMGALPNVRSPKGHSCTEEELIKASGEAG